MRGPRCGGRSRRMASKMVPSPASAPFPYDQVAAVYARYREVSGHVLDALQHHTALDAGAWVLEVGCGLLFSVNVIHHLADTAAYFRAARRVLQPGGWLCTATDSAAIIRRRQPLAHYWPETVSVDLQRYPPIERLLAQMALAGFAEIAVREIARPFAVTDSAPFRERAYSCLHLIPDEALYDGLRRLERDLERGAVVGQSEFACIWGRAAQTAQ